MYLAAKNLHIVNLRNDSARWQQTSSSMPLGWLRLSRSALRLSCRLEAWGGYAMALSWGLLSALILSMIRKEGLISQKHLLARDK
jgi:hypothetical protein